jgi:GNAT superfamily N-acetyltransferase
MEIRPLRPDDDRAAFHSGEEALDCYFRSYAGQNQFRHHVGVTYVAVEKSRILGFATVAPGHIDIEDLPASARKGLPRYPLPVLRLARLAVDRSARSQGIGAQLLRYVCRLATKMGDDYGCVGVAVDAKPGAVEFYKKHGFVPQDLVEGRSEARPPETWMFLAMRAILAASALSRPR